MKFLCVCQYGHSRSVCMTRALHAKGHEAVAVGFGTSRSAVDYISDWADIIIVFDAAYTSAIHFARLQRVKVFDIGPDVWSNPYNPELRKLCDVFVEKQGW